LRRGKSGDAVKVSSTESGQMARIASVHRRVVVMMVKTAVEGIPDERLIEK
jgi:hypothetical protein